MKVEISRGITLVAVALLVGGCKEPPTMAEESPPAPSVAPVLKGEAESAPPGLAPPPWSSRRVSGSGFPCAVEEVLATSCRRCHWDPRENDAPFSLVRWEDAQKVRTGKPIFMLMRQMVSADLMPPLDALVEPAVTPLSVEHKQILIAWVDAGGKKSGEVCKQ